MRRSRTCVFARSLIRNAYYHRLFNYPIIVVVVVDFFSSSVIVCKIVRPASNFVLPIVGGSVFAICSNDSSISVDYVFTSGSSPPLFLFFFLILEDIYRLRVVLSITHFSLGGSSLENDNTSTHHHVLMPREMSFGSNPAFSCWRNTNSYNDISFHLTFIFLQTTRDISSSLCVRILFL